MSKEFPEMKDAAECRAPAKTNLWLRILGKRDDGFHEIDTRMVTLSLQDKMRLKWRDDDTIVLRCSDPSLPVGEENLVVRAVRALEVFTKKRFSLTIDLQKNIPSGAGLGGGSSDAAAVLRCVSEMASLHLPEADLAAVGATIGSDVPFFVYNRTCDCLGRGEIVQPVSEAERPAPFSFLLIKPGFPISAAWAYQHYEASGEYRGFEYGAQSSPWGEMVNDLERPVFEKFPVLGEMKSWFIAQGGVEAALLSGSGSTMLVALKSGCDGMALRSSALGRYGENCWTYLGQTA